MMKRYIHVFLLCLLCLTACESEDYRTELDEVHAELDALKQRLDEFCEQFNANLSALNAIVTASEKNDYISGVKPLIQNGVEVGVVLSLTQGGSITIYHGKNAEDGEDGADITTPEISVRKDENGFWCWTFGGEWILDDNGDKIRAEAVIPQFKIEDRFWYVSYDKGKTWVKLARAVGADGENGAPGQDAPNGQDAHCVFKDVTLTETEVIFYLLNGDTFTLPRHGRLDVVFSVENNEINVFPGAEIKVNYTLKNATPLTKVSASSDGSYTLRLEKISESSGTLYIKCPDVYKDGYVNFIMADGNGYTAIRTLNFYESRMEFSQGMEYRIPAEGGMVRVPYESNFSYSLQIDEQAQSWLSIERTKAIVKNAEIEVRASANANAYTRTGRILIKSDNSDQIFGEIIINQASTVFAIDKAKHNSITEGEELLSVINSVDGLSVAVMGTASSWVTYEIVNTVENIYELRLKTYPNYGEARTAQLGLYSEDGTVYHGTVEIHQNAMAQERPEYMVLVVKTNMYTDGYVYLPLAGNLDCQIDWGDGTQETVKTNLSASSSEKISHKYDAIEPTEYIVRISGTVPQLSSSNIPDHSVVQVKQWGLTSLTSLSSAFNGNQKIISVATDEVGAFSNVKDFSSMFSGCSNLMAIPVGFFNYSTQATNFSSICNGCSSLRYIPSALFEECKGVTTFAYAFAGCSSLQEIPSGLFAELTNVTNFTYVFSECSSIKTLPSNLFDGCYSVTTFANAFQKCTSLEKIPVGLFDSCPKVTNFFYVFWLCSSLEEIPVSIFDKQKWVSTFQATFASCGSLKGESPFTVINGEKVHLYERANYPDYFVTPTATVSCFSSGKNLTDYSSIPSTWR